MMYLFLPMKSLFFSILLLLLVQHSYAQNYNCVLSNQKNYFVNSYHYVRGIRIDSVKNMGADIVLYPFHSPRGPYSQFSGGILDSNGGSWLGKTITIKPDGTHYFENYWNDTVIIRAGAKLNEAWRIFDDTSNVYYTATVISIDTMTVLGSMDSVKTLFIHAYNQVGLPMPDSINNQKIVLSKNHGFVSVMDLFLFPLHPPGKPYVYGSDYFLDQSSGDPKVAGNKTAAIFNLVPFHIADSTEIYDYKSGDVYEWHTTWSGGTAGPNYETIDCDSVIKRAAGPSGAVVYDVFAKHSMGSYAGCGYSTITVNPAPVFTDTMHMPEEYGQKQIWYYNPADTNCHTGPTYRVVGCYMYADTLKLSSVVVYDRTFKLHVCALKGSDMLVGGYSPPRTSWLSYYRINGVECGGKSLVGINQATFDSKTISIYPNPASDELYISFKQVPKNIHLELRNMLGQMVLKAECKQMTERVNVRYLPDGIYELILSGVLGKNYVQKIVIQH